MDNELVADLMPPSGHHRRKRCVAQTNPQEKHDRPGATYRTGPMAAPPTGQWKAVDRTREPPDKVGAPQPEWRGKATRAAVR